METSHNTRRSTHPLAGAKWALLRCEVFSAESEARLRAHPHPPCAVETFEAGLHLRPAVMRAELQSRVDAIEAAHAPDYVVLLFGLCGNASLGLRARKATLILPRAHDCITLFLGSREAYERLRREQPSSLFCSPGWHKTGMLPSPALFEKMKAHYRDLHPEDEELAADLYDAFCEQYKSYDGYFYVDFGDPPSEGCCEEVRRCACELGWRFNEARGDDALLCAALAGEWDERDFLRVPPGFRVAGCVRDIVRCERVPSA